MTSTTAGAHLSVGPAVVWLLSGHSAGPLRVAAGLLGRLLGAGAGVEADGGGRAEVQAFRCPVHRHGHAVVGQGDFVLGQALGLVAEEPGCGLFQRVRRFGAGAPSRRAAFSSWSRSRFSCRRSRPRPARRCPAPCSGPPVPRRRRRGRPAGGTGIPPSSARPWGCRCPRWSRSGSTASAPAASAARSTVPALPGSRTWHSTAISRGPASSTCSRLTSRKPQTATMPCGVTVSAIAASTSSVASRARGSLGQFLQLRVPVQAGLAGVHLVDDAGLPRGNPLPVQDQGLTDRLRAFGQELAAL